jgi:hypothetical protein
MADYGVPPKNEYKDIPADIYEVVAVDFEEVPNTFFEPETDNPNKATQLKWTLVIREEGELQGLRLTYYTGSYIGRHKRNKLTNLTRILDPNFNIDNGYDDEDDYKAAVCMRPMRVTTDVVEKDKDDGSKSRYAKVTGILPSKLGDVSETEKLFLTAKEVRPF